VQRTGESRAEPAVSWLRLLEPDGAVHTADHPAAKRLCLSQAGLRSRPAGSLSASARQRRAGVSQHSGFTVPVGATAAAALPLPAREADVDRRLDLIAGRTRERAIRRAGGRLKARQILLFAVG